jgi:hypothetical protein
MSAVCRVEYGLANLLGIDANFRFAGGFLRSGYSESRPLPDGHSSQVFGIALATFPWKDSSVMVSSSLPYFTVFYKPDKLAIVPNP